MGTAKAVLGSVFGRFLFRDATVARVETPSPRFRRIALRGAALANVGWQAGDKLEVFLPLVGTRAYTPLDWDEAQGATTLLVYLHGEAPGTAWARTLAEGASVQLLGPRRSLAAPGSAPVVVFGDETSVGLAHALAGTEPARPLRAVLEVEDVAASRAVCDQLGLTATLVPRAADDAHLPEVHRRLSESWGVHTAATLVMSGRAQAIKTLRSHMRGAGEAPPACTKAYWSVGKAGLD